MVNVDEVVRRAKELKGVKTDRDFSQLIGLSPADFSNRKKRGTLLPVVLEWGVHENVNLPWLLQGVQENQGGLDKQLLRIVIEAVEEGLNELNLALKPDKKAELILHIYEMYEEDPEVDRKKVLRLIRLVA